MKKQAVADAVEFIKNESERRPVILGCFFEPSFTKLPGYITPLPGLPESHQHKAWHAEFAIYRNIKYGSEGRGFLNLGRIHIRYDQWGTEPAPVAYDPILGLDACLRDSSLVVKDLKRMVRLLEDEPDQLCRKIKTFDIRTRLSTYTSPALPSSNFEVVEALIRIEESLRYRLQRSPRHYDRSLIATVINGLAAIRRVDNRRAWEEAQSHTQDFRMGGEDDQ